MPWWGWVLIVVAVIIIAPIKMKILKKMFGRKPDEPDDDY